ncbi:hypothetical protein MED217_15715 [Leeuwenhoekiella blandensis MED217]|uniref:Uncharacterized protein n=1 Tax=Leeuwenhoekiella blandensis (strain CECT 7118 / CCUG 51940 / KCTC 22103 / MED217) TaxID=398720 RepID=A3XI93_LEEBM|nr:hypothetical protein MED217_15715 [Leeuwenhoekiella blandensis MED217]
MSGYCGLQQYGTVLKMTIKAFFDILKIKKVKVEELSLSIIDSKHLEVIGFQMHPFRN